MIRILSAVVLAGSPVTAPAAEGTGLREDVAAILATGQTGVQAQYVGPGRSAYAHAGTGRRGTRTPVPRDGYFRIASTTKTFVATVVLQLAGEGRLALDDTVERHLPGLIKGRGNDGAKITIRDLLQHTSGLFDYVADPRFAITGRASWQRQRLRHYSARELVSTALRHRPRFEPGSRWEYSNTGYIVLGMIITRVTGRAWGAEVRDRIARPLGLRHTFAPDNPHLPKPHARAYVKFGTRWTDTTVAAENYPDGGLVSTIGDLGRFFRALLGGRLLPAELLAAMKKTVPIDEPGLRGQRYGLGLIWVPLSCGGGYWGHGGDGAGHKSREGVSADGRRSAVAFTYSMTTDRRSALALEAAHRKLIDNALCGKP
ncbi:serine hydrolase domain-containing protein [Nonomuraea typhae]|uniref:serine hydrolase domain-containing protein n=1 Tax=Nonomuraea typhae TaxID=2603600 RepID=UPI001C685682|nr:serine hydrolase domain-containing protein [Nonomuraea typhae]